MITAFILLIIFSPLIYLATIIYMFSKEIDKSEETVVESKLNETKESNNV